MRRNSNHYINIVPLSIHNPSKEPFNNLSNNPSKEPFNEPFNNLSSNLSSNLSKKSITIIIIILTVFVIFTIGLMMMKQSTWFWPKWLLERILIHNFNKKYQLLPPKLREILKPFDLWIRMTVLEEYYPFYNIEKIYERNPNKYPVLRYRDRYISNNKFMDNDTFELIQCKQAIEKYNRDNSLTIEQMKTYKNVILCQSKYDDSYKYLIQEFDWFPSLSIDDYLTVDPRGIAPKDFPLNCEQDMHKCFPYRHFEVCIFASCPLGSPDFNHNFAEEFISYCMKNHGQVEFKENDITKEWIPYSNTARYKLVPMEVGISSFEVIHLK